MTKLEKIEAEVLSLSAAEQKKFAEWYANWRADAFDEQIQSDAQNGKLKDLAAKALADHKAGRTTNL